MPTYAVTVLGHDRPGIIAEATGLLAGLGLNLEDSTMTLLRGHFAMTLVCAGDVGAAVVEEALAPLGADGALTVAVREVGASPARGGTGGGSAWVLTVHGGDRPGIVSAVIAEVAAVGGNVTDLTTRLSGDLYLLVAELDLPATLGGRGDDGVTALETAISARAGELGVRATLRPADADDL